MKRQDYIKQHALELKKLCDKRDRLKEASMKTGLTKKRYQSIVADMNFTCMYIAMEEERLLFALGRLRPEDARKEYQPGHFQVYEGIGDELRNLKFD